MTAMLYYLNVTIHVLVAPAFWRTGAGPALAAKLTAVILMIGIAAVHDFVQGPRAARAAPGSEQAIARRHRAVVLTRVNAILGVLPVTAAVRLARGG